MLDKDSISPVPEPEDHGALLRFWRNSRLLVAVVVFVLALALVLFLALTGENPVRKVQNILHGGTYGTISFEGHTTNAYAAYDGGLAIGTISGLFSYDMAGQEQEADQCSMTNPLLQTGGDTILAADIGSNGICAMQSGEGTVLNERLEGTILDASVASDGSICYAFNTKSTKTQITVRNADMNEIYHWYSDTAFFNQCCLSGKYLAGISLGQRDSSFESTAVIWRTDEEEPVAQLPLGNELYLDLTFLSGSTLCAVGQDHLQFFDVDGDLRGTYAYESSYLTHYDIGGDGFIALATNKNKAGGDYTLTTVDSSGEEMASLQITEEILDLSAAGSYVAVLTPSGLTVYNATLTVCAQTSETNGANQIVARNNGSVFLISNNAATLFAS